MDEARTAVGVERGEHFDELVSAIIAVGSRESQDLTGSGEPFKKCELAHIERDAFGGIAAVHRVGLTCLNKRRAVRGVDKFLQTTRASSPTIASP